MRYRSFLILWQGNINRAWSTAAKYLFIYKDIIADHSAGKHDHRPLGADRQLMATDRRPTTSQFTASSIARGFKLSIKMFDYFCHKLTNTFLLNYVESPKMSLFMLNPLRTAGSKMSPSLNAFFKVYKRNFPVHFFSLGEYKSLGPRQSWVRGASVTINYDILMNLWN